MLMDNVSKTNKNWACEAVDESLLKASPLLKKLLIYFELKIVNLWKSL